MAKHFEGHSSEMVSWTGRSRETKVLVILGQPKGKMIQNQIQGGARFHQTMRSYVSAVCSMPCVSAKCKLQVSSFCHPGQRILLLFSGSLKNTKVSKAGFSYNIAPCSFFRDLRISQAPFTYVCEPVSSSANKVCANVLIEVSPSCAGAMIYIWLFLFLLPVI